MWRTGTGAQLPKLPPSRPTALPTRKNPEAHSCGSKLPPKQHGAEQAKLSVGRHKICSVSAARPHMTKPSAPKLDSSLDVDESMLFAIGPDRKLFETSLHKGATRGDGNAGAHGQARRKQRATPCQGGRAV